MAIVTLARSARGDTPSRESRSTIRLVDVTDSASVDDSAALPADDDQPLPRIDKPPIIFPRILPPQSHRPLEAPMSDDPPATGHPDCPPAASLDDYTSQPEGPEIPPTPSESFFSRLKWLGLRHSSEDGRNAGMGVPLVGTSWLNRPYYFGIDLGTVWVTDRVQSDVTRDVDTYGGVFSGCDWDYYWGSELSIQRATPEIANVNVPDARRGDRLMIYTASMLYYPWGDSLYRPYWRTGIGAMAIDYPTDSGSRRDEDLWTFPLAIGIKYPVRRWLALRAEIADEIGLGNSGVATQHDLTLTFALEWRFGAHPRSYWPWNPSRHIW